MAQLDAATDWTKVDPIDRPIGWYFETERSIRRALTALNIEFMRDAVVLPDDYLRANGFNDAMRFRFRQVLHQEAGIARPEYTPIGVLQLGKLDSRLRDRGITSVYHLNSMTNKALALKGFDTSECSVIKRALRAYKQTNTVAAPRRRRTGSKQVTKA